MISQYEFILNRMGGDFCALLQSDKIVVLRDGHWKGVKKILFCFYHMNMTLALYKAHIQLL
jgi:hypothetical protein